MFKTSFKNFKYDRQNNKTIVSFIAEVKLPEWFFSIPKRIAKKYSVDFVDYDIARHVAIVKLVGTTKKSPEDIDDQKLANKIAESRAKLKFYRFMRNMIEKIYNYYRFILYGNYQPIGKIKSFDNLYCSLVKYLRLESSEFSYLKYLILKNN